HLLSRAAFHFSTPPPPRSTLFPYTTLFRSTISSRSAETAFPKVESLSARRAIIGSGLCFNWDHWSAARSVRLTFCFSTASSNARSEEHTSELQSRRDLVCCLLLEKKKYICD